MKISENWLREWANPDISGEKIVADITMAGLEVDAYSAAAEPFSGVIVAQISAIAPHPDAEKLRVCQVDNGTETVQVVCGAPNARAGLKVAFAQIGAVLPQDFKIKKAKLRGVESFGMLCGASELGMEDKLDGLLELADDAPIGADLRDYLDLNDHIIEVDLTPNRGDCLSVLGLARELAVLENIALNTLAIEPVPAQSGAVFPARIEADEACPVYINRVIDGIDISRPTPIWMQERLRRSGIRSIDIVVDITNYVMLELGQPLHAFDKAQLKQGLVIRQARQGESLSLLNGQTLTLKSTSLVIADEEKALALAGIMGGQHSGVNVDTQSVVLESAFFAPELLAGKARDYGLHTDSSHRFERGVDWQGQMRAIERATALLLQWAGGQPGPVNCIRSQASLQQKSVRLNAKRLQQVLGLNIDAKQVHTILSQLGFAIEQQEGAWQCLVPTWRFDIAIEADLIEEIARVYGYNRLPTRQLTVPVTFQARSEANRSLAAVRQCLLASGYQEAITYSFIEPALHDLFDSRLGIVVQNPISADMSVMRSSLLPGLVKTLSYNQKRQQSSARLFEVGLKFEQTDKGIEQNKSLAGLIAGSRFPESWANKTQAVDFYDIKGDIENILEYCGQSQYTFEVAQHRALHPGQSAKIVSKTGDILGFVGALHPNLNKNLGMLGQTYVFELSLDRLLSGDVPEFKALSKHPQVRRDIALLLDETIKAQDIIQLAQQQIGSLLKRCFVFDVYQGQGIEKGKKSMALALVFQHPEQSLQDNEVQGMVDTLLVALNTHLGVSLRV